VKEKILNITKKTTEIAQHSLPFWLKNFKLPIHIYYEPIIRNNLKAFKKVLDDYYPNGRVCFAAKACTHQSILKIVNEEGCGADVASYNETYCALDAGIPPEKLDLNGNCKEDFLIEEAILKGMNIIADSIEEFIIIAAIAKKLKKKPKVLLRISGYKLENITDDSVFTAGLWTKFGANINDIPNFILSLHKYPQIDFMGFHTHIGSQITKLKPYQAVLGKMIELGILLKKTGLQCRVINIGGGFPIKYVEKTDWEYITKRIKDGYLKAQSGDTSHVFVWHDDLAGFISETDHRIHLDRWTGERFYTELPKEQMLTALLKSNIIVNNKSIHATHALKNLGEPMLTIEPGRSIVEDAGITLAKVGIVRKVAENHNLVTLELGITHHGLSLIEKPIKEWTIINDYFKKDKKLFETFIGGNLCFSGDMISKYKVFLQRKPQRGDIILIHNTGAYSSSLFSANSNSFPRPDRILVDKKGQLTLIKKRDSYRQIFN